MSNSQIEKLKTYILGYDEISIGGLPKGRSTLITGTSGSAKTVFMVNYLAAGIINNNEKAIFITFEEKPEDIRRNMLSFNWNIKQWEDEQKWFFIDASQTDDYETLFIGQYDLGAIITRIEYAIKKMGATRIGLDSLGSIFTQFKDSSIIRKEMFRITAIFKKMNVTALISAERKEDYGEISRYGVEEFVTDNVIILRNILEGQQRRRTIEILKYRGTTHSKGEFPFTINSNDGIVIIPISTISLTQNSSSIRVTSGIPILDEMCGGGFFRDSIILLSGATGVGKTMLVSQFISGGVKKQEKCILFAFEESSPQLSRNALGWGSDFDKMEKQGLLKISCVYPESKGIYDHLIEMRKQIEQFKPNRVAIDSFSALERISTLPEFKEFAISITSFLKKYEITTLITSTTASLMGGSSASEAHISTITDSIILLRYIEMYGELRRGITVIKMRGSAHEKGIREYTIDQNGIHINRQFKNIMGILSGNFVHVNSDEIKQLEGLFDE